MATLIICGLLIVSAAFQGSVLPLLGHQGVHPDFILVAVVAFGILGGTRRGAIIGLCAGLMQDILFGAPLGFFAASKMISGAAAGMISDDIYKDMTLAAMIPVVFFTLLHELLVFLQLKLLGLPMPLDFFSYVSDYALIRMLMHFFVMGIIYPYLYQAQKRQKLFINHSVEE